MALSSSYLKDVADEALAALHALEQELPADAAAIYSGSSATAADSMIHDTWMPAQLDKRMSSSCDSLAADLPSVHAHVKYDNSGVMCGCKL